METILDPLKSAHRAMWALGDYDRVSTEIVGPLGPVLVEAAGVRPGDDVLDVAAGSGNASLPAARAGGRVVATDLTPELLTTGRLRAEKEGLTIDWREADAERLGDAGIATASFDVVMSCVGVMFAPFHQPVADELLRVTRPGGRIALINWTPEGFIGQLFATLKQFVAPPPPGASAGPLWGDEVHVRDLLGPGSTDLTVEKRALRVEAYDSGASFRRYFATHYGPTIAAYRRHAADGARTAELDAAIDGLGDRFGASTGVMEWEYLLVTATRA